MIFKEHILQFMKENKKLTWKLMGKSGSIRASIRGKKEYDMCPITAYSFMTKSVWPNAAYAWNAVNSIGLYSEDAAAIIAAADSSKKDSIYHDTRIKLLAAINKKELKKKRRKNG